MFAPTFSYRSKGANVLDSDSDDDSDKDQDDWKRATRRNEAEDLEKIPIEAPQPSEHIEPEPVNKLKRKRNNIWSDVLQDQMISETLDHCGIKNKPKGYGERGEESYDYTLKYENQTKDKEESDSDDKMEEDNLSDKESNGHKKGFKSTRKTPYLDNAQKEASRKIINVLHEPKKYLIFRIVKILGIEKALNLLKKTEEIEENGGMLIQNQKRRRTPGGVYLQLLKSDKDIEKKVVDQIFEGELTSYELKKKFKKEKAEKRKKKEQYEKLLNEEKQSLLDKFSKELDRHKPSTTASKDAIEMEEELPVEEPLQPKTEQLRDSDLEDGELDD